MKPILITFLLSLFSIPSFCTVWVVSNTNDSGTGSLRAQIVAAFSGDTIRFDPLVIANGTDSIVFQSPIFINKDIRIEGLYNASDSLILSGGDSTRLFEVNGTQSFVLDSVIVQNANSSTNGGAIVLQRVDSFGVSNSIFRQCISDEGAGAIYGNEIRSTYFHETNFLENESHYGSGGAVFLSSRDTIKPLYVHTTIIGCEFLRNKAIGPTNLPGYSGALSVVHLGGKVRIEDSQFNNNYAGAEGAVGITFQSWSRTNSINDTNQVLISKSKFNSNSSVKNIIGIREFVPTDGKPFVLRIDSSEMNKNVAPQQTGALSLWVYNTVNGAPTHGMILEIDGLELDSNRSGNAAGMSVIVNGNVDCDLKNMRVTRNKASNSYGGIFFATDSLKFRMRNSYFENNVGFTTSGALGVASSSGVDMNISKCEFYNNSTNGKGGVIDITNAYQAKMHVDQSSFHENLSVNRGSVMNAAMGLGDFKFNRCTFYDNSNKNGEIFDFYALDSVSLAFKNCSIIGNRALGQSSSQLISFYPDSNYFHLKTENSLWFINSEIGTRADTITSLGYNAFSYLSFPNSTYTDKFGLDSNNIGFGPFQYNGGYGKTLVPITNLITSNAGNPNDTSEAQNGAIIGIRDIGAAENCAIDIFDSLHSCYSMQWRDGVQYASDTTGARFITHSNSGCDTVFHLDLEIDSVDIRTNYQNNTITALASNAAIQWFNCQTGLPIPGETSSSYSPIGTGLFAAQITQNGCVDTTKCTSIQIVGNPEVLYGSSINVFPNPAKNQVRLQFDSHLEMGQVYIYSVDGRLKKQVVIPSTQNEVLLNVEDWKRGVYIIRFENEGKVALKRLILN